MTQTTIPHNGSETSRAAAESIRPHIDRLCQIVLNAIYSRAFDGLTREEIEGVTGLAGNTVRPRCKRLLELGLIERCPEGQIRRTKSGYPAEVLVATMAGMRQAVMM